MDIIFPEYDNPVVAEAITIYNSKNQSANINPIKAKDLSDGCTILKNASKSSKIAMIAGIDHTTRDVALACKKHLGLSPNTKTFSSCFVMRPPLGKKEASDLIIADAGVTKNPTENQLYDIVFQTYKTATKVLPETPKIAMLSFSSFGSAKDASIDKINRVIRRIQKNHPEIIIDGEMQLDCAISPKIAKKKIIKDSPVAGQANVLIVSDLNAGNILYKSLEQFGGYTAAGPILQGFMRPVSDLSRGSTKEDVIFVIETLTKLV